MPAFRSAEIGQLARELRLSPMRLRIQQLAGISHLLEILEPAKEYPYSFVCFHITTYRPRRSEDSALGGKTLIEDLVALLDHLTETHPLPSEAAQGRLYDSEALASRLRVSTKTISRWRSRGLAGCWYVFDGSKPRLAFDGRSVQRFIARNAELVRRGSMFQLMGEEEKEHIIERARELAASQKMTMHIVTQQIASETGRAVETIRYTLRRYDAEHPDEAVFDGREEARELDEATLIHDASAAGDSVKDLAARFNRKEPEIRRLITQGRCGKLVADPIPYIYNAIFEAPDATRQLSAAPVSSAGDEENAEETLRRLPADLPPYLKELYRTPLLGREEEAFLFRKMNYALHGAEMVRQQLSLMLPVTASNHTGIAAMIVRFDQHLAAAQEVKHRIIQANLRLVVSIAKKHMFGHPSANLFELVSDGNIALMRAVEKFDFARGFRFSTYGSWAIMRGFARSIPDELAHNGKFQTGHDELLDSTRDESENAPLTQDDQESVRGMLRASMSVLDERERAIVLRHFGIEREGQACTLDEIGRDLGLSKERIRQIEVKAFGKLRGALGQRGAELLAG
jgi:RNA polymerase sigma factor (sigma-70 family)